MVLLLAGLLLAGPPEDANSISFCGPGGCSKPGTYRPNSPIFGDPSYRVVDADIIEVLGGDGFATASGARFGEGRSNEPVAGRWPTTWAGPAVPPDRPRQWSVS
jgi:hypothetical protein